jgi:hypothetical protein
LCCSRFIAANAVFTQFEMGYAVNKQLVGTMVAASTTTPLQCHAPYTEHRTPNTKYQIPNTEHRKETHTQYQTARGKKINSKTNATSDISSKNSAVPIHVDARRELPQTHHPTSKRGIKKMFVCARYGIGTTLLQKLNLRHQPQPAP